MKEIYKATRKSDGRWVVGFFVEHDGKTYIYYENCKVMPEGVDTWIEKAEVEPLSMALFTGKADKNGGYIFVNDLVEYETALSKVMCIVSYGKKDKILLIPTSGIKAGEAIDIENIKEDQMRIVGNAYLGMFSKIGARND